jgi:hypothetical protein
MRSKCILCATLAVASLAYAKDPKPYQVGNLLQMDSVPCVEPSAVDRDSHDAAPSDLAGKQQFLCQEYVLQGDRVIYRIRPRDEKHAVLLPIGERAHFRIERDKLLITMETFDSKEYEYNVVSMMPRSEDSTADVTPVHLNHLQ